MFMLAVANIHVHHLLSLTLTMPWRGILLVCLRYLAALQLITARVTLTVNKQSNECVPTLHSTRNVTVSGVSVERCMRDCNGPTWALSSPPGTAFRFTGSLQREYCPLRTCTSLYKLVAEYPKNGVRLSVTITRLDDGVRLQVDLGCSGNEYVGLATLNGTWVDEGKLEWSGASIDEEHGWFNYREQLIGSTISRWTWKGEIDCGENTLTTTVHTSTTEANPTTISETVASISSTAANPASTTTTNTTANSTSSHSANHTSTSSRLASSTSSSPASSNKDEHMEMSVRNPLQTTIIASATAGGALLVIILLIIIIIMCRGQKANNSSSKTPKDSEDVALAVTNGDSETPNPSTPITGSRKAYTRMDSGYSTIEVDFTLKKNSSLNSNVYKEGGMPKQVADIYTEVRKPGRETAGQASTTTIPGYSGQTQDLQKRFAAPNTNELYTLVNKPTRPTEIPLIDMVENDIYNT